MLEINKVYLQPGLESKTYHYITHNSGDTYYCISFRQYNYNLKFAFDNYFPNGATAIIPESNHHDMLMSVFNATKVLPWK